MFDNANHLFHHNQPFLWRRERALMVNEHLVERAMPVNPGEHAGFADGLNPAPNANISYVCNQNSYIYILNW